MKQVKGFKEWVKTHKKRTAATAILGGTALVGAGIGLGSLINNGKGSNSNDNFEIKYATWDQVKDYFMYEDDEDNPGMVKVEGYNNGEEYDDADLSLSLKLNQLGLNGIDFGDKVSKIQHIGADYEREDEETGGGATHLFGVLGNVRAIKFDKIREIHGFKNSLSLCQVDLGNPNDDYNHSMQIYKYAFSGCVNLKQLNITEKSHISIIGEGAFSGCINLKSRSSINISDDNLRYFGPNEEPEVLGKWANNNDTNNFIIGSPSQSGTFSGALGSLAFGEIDLSVLNQIGDKKTNDAVGFLGCTNITKVIFPDTQLDGETGSIIDEGSFKGCINLEQEIAIPDWVTQIRDSAFQDCKKITKVSVTQNSLLENVDGKAFAGCDRLSEVSLPSTIQNLTATFAECKELQIFKIIENENATDDLNLNNGGTYGESIGVFENCDRLGSIELFTKSDGTIGDKCFAGSTSWTYGIVTGTNPEQSPSNLAQKILSILPNWSYQQETQ